MPEAMLTLHNEDKTLTFKAKAVWKESSFDITILAKKAWYTQVSEEEIEKLASERNQSTKEYYATLQDYLSNGNPDVFFNLTYIKDGNEENENAEFTINHKSGVRVFLFFVTKLKQMDFHESIYKILDDLMEKHNELVSHVQMLQKEKKDIEKGNYFYSKEYKLNSAIR
nr:uncharacterized protein LOC111418323 [Onthophagus taurus]